MNEEEINETVKEHYGFTVEEIDNMVGNLSLKINQLQQERNNYKELYEKENKNWNELKEWLKEQDIFITELPAFTKEISVEHKTMSICYGNILDKMEDLERL